MDIMAIPDIHLRSNNLVVRFRMYFFDKSLSWRKNTQSEVSMAKQQLIEQSSNDSIKQQGN